jgi:hypothetical protein
MAIDTRAQTKVPQSANRSPKDAVHGLRFFFRKAEAMAPTTTDTKEVPDQDPWKSNVEALLLPSTMPTWTVSSPATSSTDGPFS